MVAADNGSEDTTEDAFSVAWLVVSGVDDIRTAVQEKLSSIVQDGF